MMGRTLLSIQEALSLTRVLVAFYVIHHYKWTNRNWHGMNFFYLMDSACAVCAICQLVWAIGEHMVGKVL